jgi:prolipoprotein diacylglyceryltransferase
MKTTALHHRLDSLVRPSFTFLGSAWPFYGLFVSSGTIAGILFALALSIAAGTPLLSTAAGLGAGLLAAGALAMATEILVGREVYTFYHYQLAILAAAGGVLAIAGLPVLPVLDAVAPALGLVQAFGRLGCFMAGCCHGRPSRWGVRYGRAHADHGFARELVDVRLFPIQVLESLCLFALAAGGAALVLTHAPGGFALATYLVGYAGLRFGLEFVRGDAARRYSRGFSEAQWTAALVMLTTATAEIAGALPLVWWHLAVVVATLVTALAVTAYRRATPSHTIFRAGHVSEIARVLDRIAVAPPLSGQSPRVVRTSLGLGLSAGQLHHGRLHYALSARDGILNQTTASKIAALIVCLRHASASSHLLAGGHGVYHVLIDTRH